MSSNPLLQSWETAYGLPPFDKVHAEHFVPAFEFAIDAHRKEIDAIAAVTEAPTFANTLVPFDRSGRLLARIRELFFNLTAAETKQYGGGGHATAAGFQVPRDHPLARM